MVHWSEEEGDQRSHTLGWEGIVFMGLMCHRGVVRNGKMLCSTVWVYF